MKRSEMVQLIWNYIQSVECDYDCYMDEDSCNTLLRKIELAGMRPPFCSAIFQKEAIKYIYPDGNQWEPEDE
jgi:hypothetical protein